MNAPKLRYHCLDQGHILCPLCKFLKCPCGSKVSSVPSKFASKFLETLKSFQTCQNFQRGCPEMFFDNGNLEKHVKNCTFRLANCVHSGCQENWIFLYFEAHLEKSHHCPEFPQINGKFTICYDFPFDYFSPEIGLAKMKTDNGEIFFLTGCVQNQILHLWVYHYGPYDENENYKYQIKTGKTAGEEFQFSGLCFNLGQDKQTIVKNFGVFTIGLGAIKSLKSKINNLVYFQITIEDLK